MFINLYPIVAYLKTLLSSSGHGFLETVYNWLAIFMEAVFVILPIYIWTCILIYRMAGNIGVELYLAVGEMKPVLPNFNPPT